MGSPAIPEAEIDLRYPIGRFRHSEAITTKDLESWISQIEELPADLTKVVGALNEEHLNATYRPGGWTLRQVVHHLADSHMNSVSRYRSALTEQDPEIIPYDQAAWAELPDARQGPVDLSLALLTVVHARWSILLRSMSEERFARTFRHPERGQMRLDWTTGLYAWHGRHHLAQITAVTNP